MLTTEPVRVEEVQLRRGVLGGMALPYAWKKHCCGSAFFLCRSGSDPNFHADADPDPDPGWHQNNADPDADPTPSFTPVGSAEFYFIFCHSTALPVATLQCFIFLINVKYVICFQYFGQHIDIFWKKVYLINFLFAWNRHRPGSAWSGSACLECRSGSGSKTLEKWAINRS